MTSERRSTLNWDNGLESKVSVSLNLDGCGHCKINTGHKTLNHFIQSFARYGRFDIEICTDGDGILHHIFEHTGVALGLAISMALGQRQDLTQFGRAAVPMDESIADVVVDIGVESGRFVIKDTKSLLNESHIHDGAELSAYVGFIQQLAGKSKINLHVLYLAAEDVHHAIEVLFKGTAAALHQASRKSTESILRLRGIIAG